MLLKLKPKINLKIMQKGSKIIKIMKGSKNRRGLTQVKNIFLHINKQEILMYCNTKEIYAKKNIVSGLLYILSITLTY